MCECSQIKKRQQTLTLTPTLIQILILIRYLANQVRVRLLRSKNA